VVILHHAGKGESSKKFRGSSDIKASVDVAYEIEGFGDPTRLDRLKLTAFKCRFATQQVIELKYDGARFSSGVPASPGKSVTEQLRDLLIDHPGIKMADFCSLAVAHHLGRDRARAFLTVGKSSGTISLTGGANNAQYHTWSGADYGSNRTSVLR
jgi:hypothetical protein